MGKVSFVKIIASTIVAVTLMLTGFVTSVNAQDLQSWQKEVSSKIAKKQVYPRAALRKEIEGRAEVKINVDREGNIVAHTLQSSTGHELLDKEIDKLMERVSPLPKPPAGVNDSELSMVIPLAWTIQ